MKKIFAAVAVLVMTSANALAGGILTNTNQSVDFLRNPSRDAAIGLDGVYSNPAGVAFMPEGFHIAFNWQYAHQTRTINSTNEVFALGKKNDGLTTKEFEGVADAPIIPSLQAAYNKGNWSIQFNFSIPGGGGACEYDNGLGSFERVVGGIAKKLGTAGALGYDMDGYMKGRQYYFGFQVGAAYKIYDNLSVYGGLRLLYGDATYKAKISNIQVKTAAGYVDFGDFLNKTSANVTSQLEDANTKLTAVNASIAALESAGAPVPATLRATQAALQEGVAQLTASQASLTTLLPYADGVNLLCNQSGMGVAPVVGIDYKIGNFNFAAKYEFKTQIRMKNESTLNKAHAIAAVNKFRDGEKVNEDQPALLTIGAQWSPIEEVRLNAGWHYYFDKNATWYNNAQDKLDHNSYELLLGGEWDVTDKLVVSAGGQLTRYGLTDDYMNDMSFVVNSYSLGFGFKYKVHKHVSLSAAYFQTNYGTYDVNYNSLSLMNGAVVLGPGKDSYTRTNRVLGVGCQVDF